METDGSESRPYLSIRAGFDGAGGGGYIASTASPGRNGGKETT